MTAHEHDVESEVCWCIPEVLHLCDECLDDPEADADPDCWKCAGRGLVPCDAPDPTNCDESHVIVHRCDDCQHTPCICDAG